MPQDPTPGVKLPLLSKIVPGSSSKPISSDRLAVDQQEGPTGRIQDYRFEDFSFHPKLGQDNYKIRAQNQSGWEQLGRTLGNLIPNIATGIVAGIGYTAELFDSSQDYDNDLIRTMESWKNPWGEVYRENPNATFDLGDPAWWYNNIGGLVESIAEFAVPGAIEAKAFGKLGKVVSQAGKFGRIGDKAVRGTGMLTTSAHLAYMEGAMSGREIYKEVFKSNFDKNIRAGMNSEEATERAKKTAAESAALTVRTSTMMNTVMNMAALGPLFRNSENKINQWVRTQGQKLEGETAAAYKARLLAAAEKDPALKAIMKNRSGLTSNVSAMFAEGFEETNTQYAEQRGRERGGQEVAKGLNMIDDYFKKVGNEEGALNFILGAFGGIGHTVILDNIPIHSIEKRGEDGKPIPKADANVVPGAKPKYEMRRVSSKTRDSEGRTKHFNNIKDAIVADVDWYTKKNEDLQKAVKANDHLTANRIRHQIFAVHNLNAIMLGGAGNWHQEYQNIARMDNEKDLGEQMQPKIDELQEAIMQTAEAGGDIAPLQEQLQVLQANQQKVAGKTEAMQAGYAESTEDNEYKKRAVQAVSDLTSWKKLYDDLRSDYLFDGEPHSEELVGHIFAREVEQQLGKRLMDEEEANLAKDEAFMGTLGSYNSRIHLANRIGERLNADRNTLLTAAEQNNLPELKRLAQKYNIAVNEDADIPKAIDSLIGKIEGRMEKHKKAVDNAVADLHLDSGYDAWKAKHPSKNFDDYLKWMREETTIDGRLMERKVELETQREQWAISQEHLDEVRSNKGVRNFLRAADKNLQAWKREQEHKNMNDRITAFRKLANAETAAHLSTQDKLIAAQQLHKELVANVERSNALKKKLEELQKRLDVLENKKGTFQNIKSHLERKRIQAEMKALTAEIAALAEHHKILIKQLNTLGGKIEESEATEAAAAAATVADPAPVADPVVADPEPEPDAEEFEEVEPVMSDSAGTAYTDLANVLPSQILRELDFSEKVQRDRLENGLGFSYDYTADGLQPAVDAQLISAATLHDIVIKQKEFLEEEFNNKPVPVDTTPGVVPPAPPAPDVTPADVSEPGEPTTPVINAAIDFHDTKHIEVSRHVSDKGNTSMAVASASIRYMEVVKPGGQVLDQTGIMVNMQLIKYLPEYDQLDDNANHRSLVFGAIKEGDDLEFRVDTEYSGDVNIPNENENDEFGYPVKQKDNFELHSNGGKIDMDKGFENVAIAIYHKSTGQKIGYLHRADWVTAKYPGTNNYRNIVDTIKLPFGAPITNNVATQEKRIKEVRKAIAEAFNYGQTISTKVTERKSAGHPFYNMVVDRDAETAKLDPQLASKALPDKSLTFVLINNGVPYMGHQVAFDQDMNETPEERRERYGKRGKVANNIPAVLLPMPNGKYTDSPLVTTQYGDPKGGRPNDLYTIARVIEVYMAFGTPEFNEGHQKILDKVKEATQHEGTFRGLDISNEADLETFINQYFTHSQAFDEKHTTNQIGTTAKPVSKFMLHIPKAEPGKKSEIKVGTSFSGTKPKMAAIVDGKLDENFEAELIRGLGTHFKNITFTRGDMRGINDKRPFNSIAIHNTANGPVPKITKHENYNEYMKTFTTTIVYGKHRINAEGKEATVKEINDPVLSKTLKYVYGANSIIEFDREAITSTPIVKPAAAAPSPNTTPLDPFDDDFSALNPDSNTVIFAQSGSVVGAQLATLPVLNTLRDNTPAEKRNSKSPETVLSEMHSSGITDIVPNFNPFLKC